MSLWENEETARERLLQRILIGLGAAVATLIVLWVLRNAIALLTHPRNGIGFADSNRATQLINEDGADGAAATGMQSRSSNAFSPSAPRAQTFRSAPSYNPGFVPPASRSAPVRLTVPAAVGTVMSPQEQQEARYALAPLRRTFDALQDYDRHSVWTQSASGIATQSGRPAARPVAVQSAQIASVTPPSLESVDDAADGFAAMIGLYGHPDRFPEPIRGSVGTATEGMRSYLRLTEDASKTLDSSERQRLRTLAQRRLSESNAALQRADSLISSGGGKYVPGLEVE